MADLDLKGDKSLTDFQSFVKAFIGEGEFLVEAGYALFQPTIDLLKRIAQRDQSREVREAAIELLEEMGMGN